MLFLDQDSGQLFRISVVGVFWGTKASSGWKETTVEISTCPPERKVNLISPLILGGNVVKLFPLSSGV